MVEKDINNSARKIKKPWPTKDAMEQIYSQNLWGENDSQFYSGDGSHHPEIVNPYIAAVSLFLTSFKKPLTVCDLGCGDFNVGKELIKHTKSYLAVDIVPELIAYNTEKFKAENLEFVCLDVSTADLPKGDCVLLRQVLQHLSNAEIKATIIKLSNFKYVILTEHLPNGNFKPNEDIISGQGIRIKKQSGVQLLKHPFNLSIKNSTVLATSVLDDNKGIIETVLYQIR